MRFLLRLFPRAWRDRYGRELADLVADDGLSPGAAVDIARAGITERARAVRAAANGGATMVIGPAWRHPTAWAVIALLVLAPTLLFMLLSIATYQLGATGLAAVADPVNSWLDKQRVFDLLLVLSPAVAAIVSAAPLVRLSVSRQDGEREAAVGIRLRAQNLAVSAVALLTAALLVGHILFESVMQIGA